MGKTLDEKCNKMLAYVPFKTVKVSPFKKFTNATILVEMLFL